MPGHEGLIILGFGGHARSVADVALVAGYDRLLFVDPNAGESETFLGHKVVSLWDGNLPLGWHVISAAGDNARRKNHCDLIAAHGHTPATLIAPTATIGAGSGILAGSFVAHHAHIGPMARIGYGCILNTGSIVEHEAHVGDYSHVSVNATIAGRSKLGNLSMLGAGATIIDNVEVAGNVIVGGGSVVHRNITASGTYAGTPAKRLHAPN